MEKKRARSPSPIGINPVESAANGEQQQQKKRKGSQKAAAEVIVPVDKVFADKFSKMGGDLENLCVYIDQERTIYDAFLSHSNASKNTNKFVKMQLVHFSGTVYETWIRGGRNGNGKALFLGDGSLDEALAVFSKKFQGHTGLTWSCRSDTPKEDRYTFLERIYENNDTEQDDVPVCRTWKKITHNDSQAVLRLMALIFNNTYFSVAINGIKHDIQRLPLEHLNKHVYQEALAKLSALWQLLTGSTPLAVNELVVMETITDSFNTLVPQNVGREKPSVINNMKTLDEVASTLDSKYIMAAANRMMATVSGGVGAAVPLGNLALLYHSLNLKEMTPLDMQSQEFATINEYLDKTRGPSHHTEYKMHDIFRIEREGEAERFFKHPKNSNSDRRLLWHGSGCNNYPSILSEGLRIAPPGVCHKGAAFDQGIYLADVSTKSAQYCRRHKSKNMGLLLLCEAELGRDKYEPEDWDGNAGVHAKARGHISTWAKGRRVPAAWKDAACAHQRLAGVWMPDGSQGLARSEEGGKLRYNEYVVYNTNQIRLRYLVHVGIKQ